MYVFSYFIAITLTLTRCGVLPCPVSMQPWTNMPFCGSSCEMAGFEEDKQAVSHFTFCTFYLFCKSQKIINHRCKARGLDLSQSRLVLSHIVITECAGSFSGQACATQTPSTISTTFSAVIRVKRVQRSNYLHIPRGPCFIVGLSWGIIAEGNHAPLLPVRNLLCEQRTRLSRVVDSACSSSGTCMWLYFSSCIMSVAC